jgi:VIT1/CCC1 family predicted Fe2+/Mn2+ transporter
MGVVAQSPNEIAQRAIKMEAFAVSLYSYLAKLFPSQSEIYLKFAGIESNHIAFWSNFLIKRGEELFTVKAASLKIFSNKVAVRVLGSGLALRMMEREESSSISLYASLISSLELDESEKRGLMNILEDELVHEEEFIRQQSQMGGFMSYIKDATLGLNDGLVEILSVTTGLAGVYGSPYSVALGGIVVAVAGALSMGISTFTSSRSQRQVHEGILKRLATTSRYVTGVFRDRVKSFTRNQGYSEEISERIAEETTSDPRRLSEFIAKEEYGLQEEYLTDPGKAALYAGISNLIGAIMPLAPYFFVANITTALILSLLFATFSLIITGFIVSLVANTSTRSKIAEMVISGLGSASASYIIGWLASIILGTRPV